MNFLKMSWKILTKVQNIMFENMALISFLFRSIINFHFPNFYKDIREMSLTLIILFYFLANIWNFLGTLSTWKAVMFEPLNIVLPRIHSTCTAT